MSAEKPLPEAEAPAVVRSELAAIEREKSVRVLFANESGSRAWGIASPDSDYDVRFLYVPAWERYFTVWPDRDVIEAQRPGALDMSGWELRKALQLFAKGSAPMNEWLGSPIVYSEAPGFAGELRALLPRLFNPAPILFHYLGLARRTLEIDLATPEVKIKKLFYLLRPLFAARWVVERRAMPPTPFAEILAAPWISAEERAWVAELLEQKARAVEAQPILLASERRQALSEEECLAAIGPELAARNPERPEARRDLDALLLRWAGPAPR